MCGGCFGGKISCQLFPKKIGLTFVTETSPHSSHRSSQEARKFVTSCSLRGQSHVTCSQYVFRSDSPPQFRGRSVRSPLSYSVLKGRPLNLGGESSRPNLGVWAFREAKIETFQGATEPFQPDLPLWPRPPPNTSLQI